MTALERRRRLGRIIFGLYFFVVISVLFWRISFSYKLQGRLNEKRPSVRSASVLKGVSPTLRKKLKV